MRTKPSFNAKFCKSLEKIRNDQKISASVFSKPLDKFYKDEGDPLCYQQKKGEPVELLRRNG